MNNLSNIVKGFFFALAAVILLFTFVLFIESRFASFKIIPVVSLIIAVYAIVFGNSVYFFSRMLKLSDSPSLSVVGGVASIPLLVFSLIQQDYFYAIFTIIAGALYGYVFSKTFELGT